MLGDGYMYHAGKHANGGFTHSIKQENYCKWKEQKLSRFVTKGAHK